MKIDTTETEKRIAWESARFNAMLKTHDTLSLDNVKFALKSLENKTEEDMKMPTWAEPEEKIEVGITKVLNGYIVKVGCQTVVFESRATMLAELDRYYADPKKVSEEYLAKEKGAV